MIFTRVYICACIAAIIVCLYMLVRTKVAYRNQMRVCDAVYLYSVRCLNRGEEPKVFFDDMEPFEDTMYRLFDFGCGRILPKEKFLLIKPFLK